MTKSVEIVEVAPRDGFQPIGPWIPTETKAAYIRRLAAAGLRRIEIGSFVSATAIPQLRDTAELLEVAAALRGLRPQVLVPTAKRARDAVAAGAPFLVYVLSASEAHNRSNVRRSVAESAEDYARMLEALPDGIALRINLATAFDCPFDGKMEVAPVLDLIRRLAALRPDVEICLCDTTGRATPDHVAELSASAMAACPEVGAWAYHAHDTYGMGLASTYAAWQAGVRIFDAAAGGLGGCPFAPGATGNVATEDVVWMFERMGVATGVDMAALLPVAADAAALPGASAGGRARAALAAGCG
ncbi:hydroxymethylglutaryl-CoA lyase [Sediminicoccus rosea]|jgi:hydroxymethylglutaryl-CoA lyase|uniref:Hydroxymethylglutaryl-CoA lyase n=1 Tax=Sediminicoccus rosea TaxID=1225128 RepID=A0ABZ0PFT0_9PROT|nr:hydroxymethylglutaryl-CoA lyase [Sediminicoccus rosea]WPB84485.1 hydroxymethylglutaryl-CoA lyase [Sediminicoccus rosea]